MIFSFFLCYFENLRWGALLLKFCVGVRYCKNLLYFEKCYLENCVIWKLLYFEKLRYFEKLCHFWKTALLLKTVLLLKKCVTFENCVTFGKLYYLKTALLFEKLYCFDKLRYFEHLKFLNKWKLWNWRLGCVTIETENIELWCVTV